MKRGALPILCALLCACVTPHAPAAAVDVTCYHNDAASTGQYLAEPQLSATNVNSTNFGKLYSYSVDGQVYTQPLYKSAVAITTGSYQGTRNVVFIATENDSLYAFDADDKAGSGPLWLDTFINTANHVTTVPSTDVDSSDVTPIIGITSTPVINAATNTIFVCAKTKEVISGNTHYIFRLHAISLSNGAEQAGSPVVIADTICNDLATYTFVSGPSVPGTGDGAVNGVVNFNALRQHQRCALSMVNGVVYLAFGSHGDTPPYHGWVLGYSATTYQLVAVWNADPNGSDTGIWQAGGCLSSDTNGDLYLMTGNGTFTQPTFDSPSGTDINGSYGDSFVRLAVDTVHTSSSNQNSNGWGLKVITYFTPSNQALLSGSDLDLGSGAPLVLPNAAGSAAHPHLLIGAGKQGTLYLADRDSMGGYNASIDPVVQEQANAITSCFSTPAWFNGVFYATSASRHGPGTAFPISSGSFSAANAVNTPDTFGFPAATPCISGTSATDPNAIVWCLDGGNGSNQLRAYLASNFGDEIYTSAQAANNRDAIAAACKFALPTIANGRVYVPTTNGLIAYGLFSSVPPAAPSNLVAAGLDQTTIWLSWVANATNQSGYHIEQSTNGSTFTQIATAGSNALTYPVTALTSGSTYEFRVRAYNPIGQSSYSGTVAGTTLTAQPTVDDATGFSSSGSTMTLNTNGAGNIPPNAPQLQMLSGTGGEAHSAWVSNPVNISGFTTEFDFQVTGPQPLADGITFAIQRSGTSALGGSGNAFGFGGIGNGVAVFFNVFGGSFTGIYGSGTSTDVNAAASINFQSGDMMRVLLSYNGATLSETITDLATNAVFTQSYSLNIPALIGGNTAYIGFTGGTGGDSSIQNILNWTYTFNPSPPVAPVSLSGTAISGSVIGLTWIDTVDNATQYYIEQSNNGSAFSVTGSTGAGAQYYNVTGLEPAATYTFRVRAYNSLGYSAYSPAATVQTFGGMPTVDFSSGFFNSGAYLDFNSNASGSIPADTAQLQLTAGTNSEARSAWYLKQVNISAFTTTFDFQVTGQAPLADGFTFAIQRSGTSALGGTGGSYGFAGIANGVGMDFGFYQENTTGINGGTVNNVTSASTINFGSGDVIRVVLSYNGITLSESITDLVTMAVFTQSYTINIPAAIGGSTAYVGFTAGTGGYDSFQDILDWTFSSVPLAPGGLVVTPDTDTQATLSWINNALDDFSYEIDRANDSGFTVNPQTFTAPAVTSGTGTYVDTGLTGATTYYYRVRAANNAGSSAYSGTTGVLTFCAAPAGPAAIGGNGIVSMAWSASPGAASYNLYRALTSGSEGTVAFQSGILSTSATDSSATNGATWFYNVSAVNGSGPGPRSIEFSAIPSSSVTFSQWQLSQFGSVPAAESAAAAPAADPVGDGIANLMKYALDLNPYVQAVGGLPAGSVAAIGGTNYLTLTFQRPHPAPGDITYNVETTGTLPAAAWTPAVVLPGYPFNNGNGTETVRERSLLPASSPSQFIRLRVTRP